MIKYLKIKIVQYLTKNLLKMISEEEILQVTSNGYLYGKRKLGPEEVATIRSEARDFKESDVYRFMVLELEYLAFIRGRKSTSDMDNYATLMMFHNIDLMNKFLDNLAK
jgi:hypothetical protein